MVQICLRTDFGSLQKIEKDSSLAPMSVKARRQPGGPELLETHASMLDSDSGEAHLGLLGFSGATRSTVLGRAKGITGSG